MKQPKYYTHLLFLIILLGLIVRLYYIDIPLLTKKSQRETYTAEITRNLYFDNFNILYPRYKSTYTDPPGYMFSEFPLYNLAAAIPYAITHQVDEIWGKLISVLASVGAAYFLYRFVDSFWGSKKALLATTFFYLLSPQVIILSRSHQPDMLSLFCSLAALYYFSEWLKSAKSKHYLLSYLFISLMFLVKLTFFPIVFPMLYLAYKKWGRQMWKNMYLWIYATSLVPFVAWMYHAQQVHALFPNTPSGASGTFWKLSEWINISLFLNPSWYINVFYDFAYEVITVPVLLLAIIAIFLRNIPYKKLLYVWIFGLILYTLVFSNHMYVWYYQVTLLFPLLILAAEPALILMATVKRNIKHFGLFSGAILIIAMIITGRTYLIRAYRIDQQYSHVLEVAKIVKNTALPNSKVITTSDINSGDPLAYYALRKDMWSATLWLTRPGCNTSCLTVELNKYIKWGAVIYAISNRNTLVSNKEFYDFLNKEYTVITATNDYIIYDLRK